MQGNKMSNPTILLKPSSFSDGDPVERDAHNEWRAGDSLPTSSARVHLPWRSTSRHAACQVCTPTSISTSQNVLRDSDMVVPAPGLRGCVLSLTLGEREVDLFGDAVTGQDIIECDSAICNEQPCHNGGVCNQDPSGTAWFCDCAPGFTGIPSINNCLRTFNSQDLCVRDLFAMQTPAFMEAPVLGRVTETASSVFVPSDVVVASVRKKSRN